MPHVRQFVRVRQTLGAAEALDAGPASLLESDRIGAVQLDRGGRVLAANAPAPEILRRAKRWSTATAPWTPGCQRTAAACSGSWRGRCRTRGARPRPAAR